MRNIVWAEQVSVLESRKKPCRNRWPRYKMKSSYGTCGQKKHHEIIGLRLIYWLVIFSSSFLLFPFSFFLFHRWSFKYFFPYLHQLSLASVSNKNKLYTSLCSRKCDVMSRVTSADVDVIERLVLVFFQHVVSCIVREQQMKVSITTV